MMWGRINVVLPSVYMVCQWLGKVEGAVCEVTLDVDLVKLVDMLWKILELELVSDEDEMVMLVV